MGRVCPPATRAPDSPDADEASTDDRTDDEREQSILDRLVDILWILPW
ncbi:hypothetical protein C441_14696 [Haloferax sulfurifontis ATCC BAA-897]|uniref:Uncharacterized protein n=1 Tax=Haloferax sulfurifontis ATCC BAA-897 TaxID=662480 RepID=M0HZM0_9EURY|nr:hypothetical protein C441_14696 [Haloferax sulfurifontis ATCC BAA-897]